METLLPSEIARLVYGYLVDQKCESAASSFLASSLHLGECYEVSKRGRKFNTRVSGLSLLDILERFTDAVCVLKSYSEKRKKPRSTENVEDVDENGSLLSDLSPILLNSEVADSETSKKKTVFFKLTLPEQKTSAACSNTSSQAVEPSKDGGETEELEGEAEKEKRDRPSIEEGTSSAPPQSSSGGKNTSLTLDESLFHMMLENTELHHRLAENVEKVKDSSGGEVDGTGLAKKVVNDPDFEELLHMLTGSLSSVPKPEDGTSPEDTDKENGEPEGMGKTASTVSSKDNDTLKKIEVQNHSAVEEILAVNKRALEENPPVNVTLGNLIQNKVSCVQTVQIAQQVPIVTTFPAASPIVLETVSSDFDMTGFRKILPKPIATVTVVSDPVSVVETQQTFIGSSPSGCLKPRGARTRGGVRGKRGGRGGVRSITPQLSHHISDNNISVVFVENDRYMRTRAMSKRQDNNWTLRPVVEKLKIGPESCRSEEQQPTSQSTEKTDGSKLRTSNVEEPMDVAGSDLKRNKQPVSPKNALKSKRSPKSRMESEEKDEESTATAQNEETQASESTATIHIEEKEASESTATVHNEETLVSEATANTQSEESKDLESTATVLVEEKDASGSTAAVHSEEIQASEPTATSNIEETQASESTSTPDIEEKDASQSTTITHIEKAQDSESTETTHIEETVKTQLLCEDTTPSTVENNHEAVSVTKSLNETTETNEVPPEEIASHSGEETPDQPKDPIQNKNKISLSTPRRGSHVRVLDFITPEKSVASRKAYTSPKEYSKAVKLNTSLDKAKREIFKSKFDTPNILPPKTGTSSRLLSNESKLNKIPEDEEIVSESIVAIREEFVETHKILPRPLRKPTSTLKSPFKNKSSVVKTTDEIKISPKKVSWDEDIRKFANATTSGCIKKKTNVRKTCKKRASPKGRDPKPTKRKNTRKIDSPETDDVVSPDNKKLKTQEKLNRSSKRLGLSARNKRKKQNVSAAFCETDDSSDLETSVGIVSADVKETNPEEKIGDGSEIVESSVGDKPVKESTCVSAPLSDKKESSEIETVVHASTDDSTICQGNDILNSSAGSDILNSSTVENQTKESSDVEKQNSFEVNSQKFSDLEINMSETPCKLLNDPRHVVEGTPVSRVLESAAKFSSTSLVTPSLPLTPKPRDDTTPEKSSSPIQKTVSISSNLDNVDIIVDPGKNDQLEDSRDGIVLSRPPQCNQPKKSVKTVIDDNDDDDDDDEESLFESLNLKKLNQNNSKTQSDSQKQKLCIYTSSSSDSTESSDDRTSCKVDEVSDKAKEKELFGDHSLDSSDEDLPPPPVRLKRRGRLPKNIKNRPSLSKTKNQTSKKDEASNKQSKKTSDNVNIETEVKKSSEDTVSIGKEKAVNIADVENEDCIRLPLNNESKSNSNCADKVEVGKDTLALTDSVENDNQINQNENSCKRLFGGLFDQPDATTPLKNPASEEIVTNNVQLTPFTKIILNQLGQMSPCSNSMLESVLIQEGSRLELENKIQTSVNHRTESDKGDSAVLKEAIKDITPLPSLENTNVVSSQIDAFSTEDGSEPKVLDQRNEQPTTVQKSSATSSPPNSSEKSVHNKRKTVPSKLCNYTSDECLTTKSDKSLRTIKNKVKCKVKKDKNKNSMKNLSPTKTPRGTTKKPKLTPDKSLEKIEEEVLKECLAKARSKMSSPPKSRTSLSQYAFDKLKKIQNSSILLTSSSSDEDNSLQINLVDTSKKKVLSSNIGKKSGKASVFADLDQDIPPKTSEPSKRLKVVNDSIPTLHLTEEGHMSVTTDGSVKKLSSVISPKIQKENDLCRTQVSKSRNDLKSFQDSGAVSVPEYCSKSNKDTNVPISIQERGSMKNQEDKSESIQGNYTKSSPENVKYFDFTSKTTSIPKETPSFSKYLNRYSYTFLFNDCEEEGTGSSITLRSSPFLNVFELVPKESLVTHKNMKLQGSSPEVHHRSGPSSGSQGSSKSSESMKSPLNSSRRQHATRYESPERPKPHKARDRTPERRISSKKRRLSSSSSEDERREPGFHSRLPYSKKRHSFRGGFRHSFARPRLPSPPKYFKSRFDPHRRHHLRSPSSKTSHHQLDRRREHHGKSSNTKSRPKDTDDITHKSAAKRVEASRYPPPEDKYGKKAVTMELEEGELSNSSDRSNALRPGPEPSASEAKRKGLESLLSEEGRALLKGVDLETFLTALHGSEKDSN